ncbi:protein kinase [Nannocystis bainbridge]|uniref:Protein kinase n=1 Tax=Nannocystis bainbridge TaxID=2995303 RepID=A0ABT5DT65_9BACT|nr:protein kinase [Nannocystis bainbridge]MDC0716831.1 protein kinase [Nannocystis bainbridge]
MENPQLNSDITFQRSRIVLSSQVQYDLEQVVEEGMARPRLLGAGRFAKVFAAHQLIAGQPSRRVAFKVLHDNAGYQDERLFSQEVTLNREFTGNRAPGITPLLDVLLLGPLVLCGCGTLYHPTCPNGCGVPVERIDLKGRLYPVLRCNACDYELSAEFVPERGGELTGRRTKPCCSREMDPYANTGSVINFALREVMIMEVLESNLAEYAACIDYGERGALPAAWLDPGLELLGLLHPRKRQRALAQRVSLLAKVNLMVQIGETVAWLHERMQVVHKDLAPDNIMVHQRPAGTLADDVSGVDDVAALLDHAANQSTEIRVIDFGLADKEKLTRSWYEDADTNIAATKLPYLSPEARYRRQSIGTGLEFDHAQRRFRIPAGLAQSPASIRVGDIIADKHDRVHAHDLTIARIEDGHAYFEGNAPKHLPRHLEIVRPLGEAHDVYALGATFHYILTGRHDQVEALGNFAGAIQDQPCGLEIRAVCRRDNYANRRNSIREPFFRDEMMLVILRAMVRGLPGSFVIDRTERGAGPARMFLAELKLIQQELIAEVFAARSYARELRSRQIKAAPAMVLLALVACYALIPGKCESTEVLQSTIVAPQVAADSE